MKSEDVSIGETEATSSETETEGRSNPQATSSNREEEMDRIRNAQLAALKRERELKRATIEALRREARARVAAFSKMSWEERAIRRKDIWWSDLVKRQPELTNRVRQVCEMWSGPKKIAEAKKVMSGLEERRRMLAGARARLMQELKNKEYMEEVEPCRRFHLQNQGQDRSCASCGYRSAEDDDNDDTVADPDAIPGQQDVVVGRAPAEANRAANAGRSSPVQILEAGPSVVVTRSPTGNNRQEQMDADYLFALALQGAELRSTEGGQERGGGGRGRDGRGRGAGSGAGGATGGGGGGGRGGSVYIF